MNRPHDKKAIENQVTYEFDQVVTRDGGWGWIIVVAGFFAHVITHGALYSFGILFIALQESFHGSKAETSWIGAIATSMVYLTGPLSGYLTNRFGCRVVTIIGALVAATGNILSVFAVNLRFLYFSMGIMAGCGYGLVFLPTIVVVSENFTRRRSLACSIALCGAGSGAFVFNPLTKYFLGEYGWRGTLLIESGIVLNCIVCGLWYRPLEYNHVTTLDTALDDLTGYHKETEVSPPCGETFQNKRSTAYSGSDLGDSEQEMTTTVPVSVKDSLLEKAKLTVTTDVPWYKRYSELFTSQTFLLFTLSQFFFFFGFYFPFIYLPDKAKNAGINDMVASWLVSAIGMASVIGRLVFGYLADKACVNRLLLFNMAFLISGVSTALGPLYTNLPVLFLYATVYGAFTGVTLAQTSVVLADLLGIERLTDAFGMNNLFTGIAVLIGPPISGWIFDISGSYDTSFVVAGVVMATGAVIMFALTFFIRRNENGMMKPTS